MEIHKPKPVHGWREFLVEIGVIVIGVLIALAAEQMVEAARWSEKVQASREAIHAEMARNGRYYAFLVATEPCVVRRLNELAAATEGVAQGRRQAPIGLVSVHVGDMIDNNAWEAARAEQTLTHLPRAELTGLSGLYAQQADFGPWVAGQEQVWATLRILEGDPNRLGPGDLPLLRNALQQARNIEFLMAMNAGVELRQAAALGVPPPTPNPADVKKTCAPLARTAPADPMGRP